MDTWKLLIGLVVVLVLSGVAVIVWAVLPSHRNRRSGPPQRNARLAGEAVR